MSTSHSSRVFLLPVLHPHPAPAYTSAARLPVTSGKCAAPGSERARRGRNRCFPLVQDAEQGCGCPAVLVEGAGIGCDSCASCLQIFKSALWCLCGFCFPFSQELCLWSELRWQPAFGEEGMACGVMGCGCEWGNVENQNAWLWVAKAEWKSNLWFPGSPVAITVCSLVFILNSFVCCGEFSGFFVLYVKNIKRCLLFHVCSDTSHWYGQQSKRREK